MSTSSLQQGILQTILVMLDETFDNVQGIYLDRGTSLFETLATITAEEASRPVSARCATLAAQVEHVRFYLEMTLEFAQGRPPAQIDWGEIWRTVAEVTPEQWASSQHKLRETYNHLLAFLKGITHWGEDELGGAIGMVVHTAYHLGEIRQALCTLKS